MSDSILYEIEDGNVVLSKLNPAAKKFYSDTLLIDRPLDAFGCVPMTFDGVTLEGLQWHYLSSEFNFAYGKFVDGSRFHNDLITNLEIGFSLSSGLVNLTYYGNDYSYLEFYSEDGDWSHAKDFSGDVVTVIFLADLSGIVDFTIELAGIEISLYYVTETPSSCYLWVSYDSGPQYDMYGENIHPTTTNQYSGLLEGSYPSGLHCCVARVSADGSFDMFIDGVKKFETLFDYTPCLVNRSASVKVWLEPGSQAKIGDMYSYNRVLSDSEVAETTEFLMNRFGIGV